MAERGEENRFAHLLAPIRDLGQNWHTDIAAELSDYLTQLEEITFTFDGGNTNLNFAEGESWRGAGVPGTHSLTGCYLRPPAQPRCSSRAPPASTRARWSTCTSWCTTRWRLWRTSGACARNLRSPPRLTRAARSRVASDPDAAAQGEYLDDGDEDVAAFLALDDALQGARVGSPV